MSSVLGTCGTSCVIFVKSLPVMGPEPEPLVILMTISKVLCLLYQHNLYCTPGSDNPLIFPEP